MTKRKQFNDAAQSGALTALITAMDNGDPATARGLIDNGKIEADFLDDILIRATERGYIGIVQAVLDKGADPNAMDGEALEIAARKGNVVIVDRLLTAGATADLNQSSALRMAVKKRHRNVVKRFLETDCGFTKVGFDLVKSALHNCDDSMLDLLMGAGFNPLKHEEEIVNTARNKMEGTMMPTVYYNLKKYKYRSVKIEVSPKFFENYKNQEQIKRGPLQEPVIVVAAQSDQFDLYLAHRQAAKDPLRIEDLQEKDKRHNSILQILATRGQIDVILNPRLWEKQEDNAWQFIKAHLRHEEFDGKEEKLDEFKTRLCLQKAMRQDKPKKYQLKSRRP
ncbi:MAG: ankyrin repeat domain-containing protein [Pseudomonadota bacterium]